MDNKTEQDNYVLKLLKKKRKHTRGFNLGLIGMVASAAFAVGIPIYQSINLFKTYQQEPVIVEKYEKAKKKSYELRTLKNHLNSKGFSFEDEKVNYNGAGIRKKQRQDIVELNEQISDIEKIVPDLENKPEIVEYKNRLEETDRRLLYSFLFLFPMMCSMFYAKHHLKKIHRIYYSLIESESN